MENNLKFEVQPEKWDIFSSIEESIKHNKRIINNIKDKIKLSKQEK